MGWLLTGCVNFILYIETECKSCHQRINGSAFFQCLFFEGGLGGFGVFFFGWLGFLALVFWGFFWGVLFYFIFIFLVSQFKRSLMYYASVSSIWRDSLISNIIRDPSGHLTWPFSIWTLQ